MSPIDLDAPTLETFEAVVPEFSEDSIDATALITFEGIVPEFAEYDLEL